MRIGIMLRNVAERQGTGIYTRNLVRELLRQDQENEYVLFYSNPDDLGRYAGPSNVTETVVTAPIKLAWDQCRMPREVKKNGLDLLFHPKFTLPLFASCKTVMSIHGASWFVHPELYANKLDLAYIKACMPLYCRKADAILSNSQLTTDDFVRILKVPREKIHTIYLGTNESFRVIDDKAALEEARKKYKLPDKFILSVIRYDPRKNFENLIRAFGILRNRIPCKLVATGVGVEKYRDELPEEVRPYADDITFLGWVEPDDLPMLYNLARCKFFPSVYEEFGIPTCEAMACGCPPVVSKTGALPEIAGDAGLIVDPRNPEEMADALEKLYTDDELQSKLAARSLERAKLFTWTRCAESTLKVLNSLA